MNRRRSNNSRVPKRELEPADDSSSSYIDCENVACSEDVKSPLNPMKRLRLTRRTLKPLAKDTINKVPESDSNSVFAKRYNECALLSRTLDDPAHISLNESSQRVPLNQVSLSSSYKEIENNNVTTRSPSMMDLGFFVQTADLDEDGTSDIDSPCVDVGGLLRECFNEKVYETAIESTAPVECKAYHIIDVMVEHFKNFDENVIMDDNTKLQTKLMYNQKKNLHFMVHREKCQPFSGILADDMGLGKTLSMIAFILYQKDNDTRNFDEDTFMKMNASVDVKKFYSYTKSKATLIVVPGIILKQWQDEIKKHVRRMNIKYVVYNPKHSKDELEVEDLLDVDIVLTTYDVVRNEYLKIVRYSSLAAKLHMMDNDEKQKMEELGDMILMEDPVLPNIFFERVVLDEVHMIKKAGTRLARACCLLNGIKRWGITGTPVQNSLNDFYSIVKFLKIVPFDDKRYFNYLTTGRSDKKVDHFNNFMKCILIRNEKDLVDPETGRPILDVPKRNISDIFVDFGGIERRVYERMYFGFRPQVTDIVNDALERKNLFERARYYKQDEHVLNPFLVKGQHISDDDEVPMSMVLSLTTRLRQACCHMNLVSKCVDMNRLSGVQEGKEVTEIDSVATQLLGSTQELEEERDRLNATATTLEQVFSKTYQSPKVRAVLEKVKEAISRNDKCIIVSQWTSMLDIFAKIFDEQGVNYLMLTGRDSIAVRDERIAVLNGDPNGPKICLLSLLASGTGVNLIGANHMFLVDLFWNPAVEKQCFDRIYRFGQSKETFIYRFICNNSIERKVLKIQEKKNRLSLDVLQRKMKRTRDGYDIRDIKNLWGI